MTRHAVPLLLLLWAGAAGAMPPMDLAAAARSAVPAAAGGDERAVAPTAAVPAAAASVGPAAAAGDETFDLGAFLEALPDPAVRTVLAAPARHRVQVIYTRITRDASGRPAFASHRYRLDPREYHYPASTVKLPVALLALERLAALGVAGLDREAVMLTGAANPWQTAATQDAGAPGGRPSVGHYVRKIMVASDNDAFNRLYEWLGPDHINATLRGRGYAGVAIVHRLSVALSAEQNRMLNPVRFLHPLDGRTLLALPARVDDGEWSPPRPLLLGRGERRDGALIAGPKDFSVKNHLPLQALHDMVQALIFPEAVAPQRRFRLTPQDRRFVLAAMGQTPAESGIAEYATLADDYVKFLLPSGGDGRAVPGSLRVFNKVGEAYGFLTDAAYVADLATGVEFLLAATVYVNANGIFNDDEYEYDTLGYPFLRAVGEAVWAMESARRRAHGAEFDLLRELFGDQ